MSAVEDDRNFMLEAALAAYDAGLCVVRAHDDGSKAPVGTWKQWQTTRPPRAQVARWFADGHPGMGIICGAVSGNLEMLELEGVAVREGIWDRLQQRCDEAGLGPVLDRIVYGYSETTPSAGIHMVYRSDEIDGNLKLARRDKVTTLIETRGEGGFVVVAPSHGPVHPTGQAWELENGSFASIAAITPDERRLLHAICREFDEVTPEDETKPLPDAIEANITIAPITVGGHEGWMQAVIDELDRKSWRDVLEPYGWTYCMTAKNVDYWRRPDKSEGGFSATTNAKGTDRLIVFSSNTPFSEYTGRGLAPSYDRLDVIATYSHGGDRVAAARALAGPGFAPRNIAAGVQFAAGGARNMAPDSGQPDAVDPVVLPEEFWQSRAIFGHIRTAARARLISPDALFGAVLARVALLTDHRFVLPATVGRFGTLDLLLGLSGGSGAGKGSTLDTAADVLPAQSARDDYRTKTAPIGSGEGMVHAYFEPIAETIDGKRKTVYRRRWEGILFRIDEGQALGALAQRSGQTTMTTIRSAWSGEMLGGSYASADKKVSLEAGTYRFVGVMAIQPALARDILADHIGGTPQRFIWLSMMDPDVPDVAPAWPGPINWSPPVWSSADASPVMHGRMATVIVLADEIVAELHAERRHKLRNGGTSDDHAALRRLKVATLLAILDERLNVTIDDWHLAGLVAETSKAAIEQMRHAIEAEEERVVQRDVSMAGRRAQAAELARASVANETDRVARTIGRHVHKHHAETGKPCHRRCISKAVRSDLRHVALAGIARAIAVGWLLEDDDEGFTPGDSRPA